MTESDDHFRGSQMLSAVGGTAAFSSFIVVASGILFPELIRARSRPISHILFFISLADFFADIGASVGFPLKDNAACKFQVPK